MKKQITFLSILLLFAFMQTFAQAPHAFKYQCIARDNSGNIIADTKISFQMSILHSSTSGSVSYEETDTATTNQFGLANLSIGTGTVVLGIMDTINWGKSTYYIKIEFDPAGGSNFTLMGISQMLSVPYALYSQSTGGSWNLIGNSGTSPGTNFIGTKDTEPLEFKVNNQKAGLIDDSSSTFLGFEAGNTTAGENTVIGYQALFSKNTAPNNTVIGYRALFNGKSAQSNTVVGMYGLYQDTSGGGNVADGFEALYSNTNSSYNTAIGFQALYHNTIGTVNTATGYGALFNNTIGGYNTADGFGAGPSSSGLSNTTALGYDAYTTANNSVVIGNASVTSIGGYANWSNISDGRFKNNIQQHVHGLDFIMKLKPVTYNLDVRKLNSFLGVNDKDEASIEKKASITYSGFLAQDVEQAAQEVNYDFSGIIKPENDNDHYKISYADFVVPIVKALQEQQQMIDELKKQNEVLLKRIEQLEKIR